MKISKKSKVSIIAVAGTVLEWYDFALLGAMAPVLSQLFFPESNRIMALVNIFIILAVGVFSRILGAIVLGHIGDKYGRLKTMLFSIIIVSITTLFIALLPTYHTIGVLAPLLLIILRIIQGFGLGGEHGGGITLLYESSNEKNRIFRSSLSFFAIQTGLLLGFLVTFLLVKFISMEQLLVWGWRLPFFLGGILGLICASMRYYMTAYTIDSTSYSTSKKDNKSIKPISLLFKNNYSVLLLAMGIWWHATVLVYFNFFFIPAYLEQIDMFSAEQVMLIRVICIALYLLLLYGFGMYAHKLTSGVAVMKIGAIAALFLSAPLMILINSGQLWALNVGMLGLTVVCVIYYLPLASVFGDIFPTSVRYSGISISINAIAGIFGGTAPILMTLLAARTNSISYTSLYLIITSIIAILCLSSKQVIQARQSHPSRESLQIQSTLS